MGSKRIVIVVDSAAELNFHWHNVLKDLLADILRYLHHDGLTSQDPVAPRLSLGLIVYGSQGPSTKPQVQPWGWTDHLSTFLEWLSTLSFASGDFSEAALACGLSTALKIIAEARGNNEAQEQTHCILVSSYKSSPFLRTVPEDQILDHEKMFWDGMDKFLFNATLVARNFAQSFVSLSVVSPKHSLKLKEIFWAGNAYNPRAECYTDDEENNNYLILLSDNFREAHAALCHRKSIVALSVVNHEGKDEDMQIVGDNFTAASHGNQPEASHVDIYADIKKWLDSDCDENVMGLEEYDGESSTNKHDLAANCRLTVEEMIASFEDVINQPVRSLLDEQERDKSTHGIIHSCTVNPGDLLLTPLCAQYATNHPETANTILPSNTNHLDFLNVPESQTIGRVTSHPLVLNPEPWEVTPQSTQYVTKHVQLGGLEQNYCWTAPSKSHLGTCTSMEHTILKNLEPVVNYGGTSSTCNLKSSNYLRCSSWEQMVQDDYQQKRKLSQAFGQPSTFNPTGSGNFVVNSIFGEKSFAMMNTHGYKTSLLHGSVALSERCPGGYVKAWEGDLTDMEEGDVVVIDRLVVYRKSSTSQTLFSSWPERVHLEQLISRAQLDDMQFIGKVEYLYVHAVRNKSELFQIAEVVCAYIKLPHQTLVLYPSSKWSCFVGVLCNGVLGIPSSLEFHQANPGK